MLHPSSERLKIMRSLMKNSAATVLAFKRLPIKQVFRLSLLGADTVSDATSVPFRYILLFLLSKVKAT